MVQMEILVNLGKLEPTVWLEHLESLPRQQDIIVLIIGYQTDCIIKYEQSNPALPLSSNRQTNRHMHRIKFNICDRKGICKCDFYTILPGPKVDQNKTFRYCPGLLHSIKKTVISPHGAYICKNIMDRKYSGL